MVCRMLERVFALQANQTTGRRELLGGLTTFAAMAYILIVNPLILSQNGATGMEMQGLITVTALACAFGCFLMASMTNFPIALAPGMGMNSFIALVVILQNQIPWQGALAIVFWNGVLFFLLSVSGVRSALLRALPRSVMTGIQCGIGFFIAFIGLKSAGIIVGNPVTLVAEGHLFEPGPLLALLGLVMMTWLTIRRVPGAIILTIILLAVIGLFISAEEGAKITSRPEAIFSLPASISQTFLQLDWFYPFKNWQTAMPIIFTLLLLDLFDTLGTLVGLGRQAGMMDKNGHMPKLDRALTANAVATSAGALLGTSPVCSYVESATGIEAGARTGMSTTVVGICFLLALFLTPLISVVPMVATAPALIMVGLFMAQGLRDLDYSNLVEVAPAILTALLIPLTFSITHGISIGILFYTVLQVMLGNARRLPFGTWIICALFIGMYLVNP